MGNIVNRGKNKIKICYIIHNLIVGGAELFLLDLCRGLKNNYAEKYDIFIVASAAGGPLKEEFEKSGFRVICLNLSGVKYYKAIWKIYKVLLKERPHIVHTHLLLPDKYGQIAAFLACCKIRVSTIHNMELYLTKSERMAVTVVKLLASRIIAVSKSVRDNVISRYGYRKDKIDVIYTMPFFRAKVTEPRKISFPVRLINLSNVKEAKGHLFLVKAAIEMKKVCENFIIDIYGDYNNEYGVRVHNSIIENGLQDNIRLMGSIEKPSDLISNYHIMISLSLFEGFSLAIIEGMCAGLPLILSDIPSFRELMEGIDDFAFVKHDALQEISSIFNRLITDEKYYLWLSAGVLERSKDFSKDNIVARHDRFYSSLVGKRK